MYSPSFAQGSPSEWRVASPPVDASLPPRGRVPLRACDAPPPFESVLPRAHAPAPASPPRVLRAPPPFSPAPLRVRALSLASPPRVWRVLTHAPAPLPAAPLPVADDVPPSRALLALASLDAPVADVHVLLASQPKRHRVITTSMYRQLSQ